MEKEILLRELKYISDAYFNKKDYTNTRQINRAMDIVEDYYAVLPQANVIEKPPIDNNKFVVSIRSKFVFVRYRNWSGQEKIQAIAANSEEKAKQWLKDSGFEEIEVKQIYFL